MKSIIKFFYYFLIKIIYFFTFKHKEINISSLNDNYGWKNHPFDKDTMKIIQNLLNKTKVDEIYLGRINKDGRLISKLSRFPFFDVLDDISVEKKPIKVSIVIKNGILALKKDFASNRKRYMNEYLINSRLLSQVNVPKILFVDDKKNIIYKSLIQGRTIRDLLVQKGARILINQTKDDSFLDGLSYNDRLSKIWERGKKVILKSISQKTIDKIVTQTNIMHEQGVHKISLTYGNIIIDEFGNPWFIDFENSIYLPFFFKSLYKKYLVIDNQMISNLYI